MKIISFLVKYLSYNVILSYFGFGHFFSVVFHAELTGQVGKSVQYEIYDWCVCRPGFYSPDISDSSRTVHKFQVVHIPATCILMGRSNEIFTLPTSICLPQWLWVSGRISVEFAVLYILLYIPAGSCLVPRSRSRRFLHSLDGKYPFIMPTCFMNIEYMSTKQDQILRKKFKTNRKFWDVSDENNSNTK